MLLRNKLKTALFSELHIPGNIDNVLNTIAGIEKKKKDHTKERVAFLIPLGKSVSLCWSYFSLWIPRVVLLLVGHREELVISVIEFPDK